MLYVVRVTFLSGSSISPADFFRRVNARWSWLQNGPDGGVDEKDGLDVNRPRSAVCIADLESIEQFAIDVSVIPCGISNIDVEPLPVMTDIPSILS